MSTLERKLKRSQRSFVTKTKIILNAKYQVFKKNKKQKFQHQLRLEIRSDLDQVKPHQNQIRSVAIRVFFFNTKIHFLTKNVQCNILCYAHAHPASHNSRFPLSTSSQSAASSFALITRCSDHLRCWIRKPV